MDIGDVIGGRFAVEALAGEGGMGLVFRASDRLTNDTVAIKVLRDEALTPVDAERFEREAELLARLAHPSIVRYVAHGLTARRERYLVMEWLAGETLEDRIARGLTLDDALAIVRQTAAGLGSAHRFGVVHRDVKPTNVFLVERKTTTVRVIDFGIARVLNAGMQTLAGMPIGTPTYMSPEQARGDPAISPASDVFSLGCVLFECLTGQPPFVGQHPIEIIGKILVEEAPRVRTFNDTVSFELDALVARMLSKDARDRPSDGDAVLSELDSLGRMTGTQSLLPAPRSDHPELTMVEKRWLSVALVDVRGASADRANRVTTPGNAIEATLEHAVAMLGCHAIHLANGPLLIVSDQAGSATEQAERAARAAIRIRDTQGDGVIAVVTGRARVSGRIPEGEVMTRAVELLRAPSQQRIRLDSGTANLLASRFVIENHEAVHVLVRERPEAHERQTDDPLVGRAAEMALLEAMFGECLDEPRAHAVIITGAPGIGKSRLKDELLRVASSRGASIWQGRCDPIGAGSSLGLLARMLRSGLDLFGLDAAAVHARLAQRLSRLPRPSARARDAEFLAELLHATTDEASLQLQVARRNPLLMGDQMRQAWEELVCAECASGPVILVLENLQWGDLPSVSFIESLMRRAAELPLLVFAIGRPELDDVFPALWASVSAKRISLGPLSARASQKLARSLLGADASDEALAALVEHGQGNPFLLEELGRAVADGPGAPRPASVLAMAHARIESFDAAARRVLRAASIFGRQFWRGGVATPIGGEQPPEAAEWIAVLLTKYVIVRRMPSRFALDEEYAFRQPLLGEAAYASLTDEDRALGHRLAAAWLERNGESDPLVLAEHYRRGEEHALAAPYYALAASKSLEGCDFKGAITQARAGLVGKPNGQLHLTLAEALRWSGSFAEAHPHALEAVALLSPGSALHFRACEERSIIALRLARFEDAEVWSDEALASDADRSDSGIASAWVRYLSATSRSAFQAGAYERAEALYARVNEALQYADPSARADAHRLAGARARHNGDLSGDTLSYALALESFREADDTRNACNAQVSLGFGYIALGQLDRARLIIEEALATAERLELHTIATRARQNLGLVLGWCCDLAPACALLTRVANESRAQADVRFEGWTRIYLANVRLAAGDVEAAVGEAMTAATLLASTPPALAGALAARARALVASGRGADALPVAGRGMQILSELGSIEEFEMLVRLAWVDALAACGREDEHAVSLEEAKTRIFDRADAISDAGWRRSFLDHVPENVAILSLSARQT
ncbi:hypothetical protein BH09MYX1_BH09MYX1_08300 [soil metagenome]